VDYTHGAPLPGMPGNTVGQVPVLRVYGVTGEGQSVLCNVHGFLPYLWIPAPPEFRPSDVDMVRRTLNARLESSNIAAANRVPE
jgi:DNA polymerase delta subunit 1